MAEAAVTVDSLKMALAALKPERLSVLDVSGGCGSSYSLVVVSAEFEKKLPLVRQRMVHEAIGGDTIKRVHALEIVAITPSQFAARKAEGKIDEEHLSQMSDSE